MRKPRADAEKNRGLLVSVARDLFARRGVGISVNDVAAAAGVGVGTLYRHFPTKDALVAAVVSARVDEAADAAERDAAAGGGAGDLFLAFLDRMWRDGREKRDLVDALTGAGVDVRAATGEASKRLRKAAAVLLTRAQHSGAVRADVDVDDLFALLAAAYLGAARLEKAAADRLFRVLVDGLRATTQVSPARVASRSRPRVAARGRARRR